MSRNPTPESALSNRPVVAMSTHSNQSAPIMFGFSRADFKNASTSSHCPARVRDGIIVTPKVPSSCGAKCHSPIRTGLSRELSGSENPATPYLYVLHDITSQYSEEILQAFSHSLPLMLKEHPRYRSFGSTSLTSLRHTSK